MTSSLATTAPLPFEVDAHPPVLHRLPRGEEAAPPPAIVEGTDLGDAIEPPSAPGWDPLHLDAPRPIPDLADVLDDILAYRRLRARMLAGERLDKGERWQLDRLEARLRSREATLPDGRPNAREYHRFPLRFAAVLRTETESRGVFVEDISAGGVKLALVDAPEEGERVWLAIDRDDGGVAVLPARIVWVRPGVAGLMFAGAPFVARG